jgi:hypothetical protein
MTTELAPSDAWTHGGIGEVVANFMYIVSARAGRFKTFQGRRFVDNEGGEWMNTSRPVVYALMMHAWGWFLVEN